MPLASLDELTVDLWSRWARAFDNPPREERQNSVRLVYAREPRFALSGWGSKPLAPGGRVFAEPVAGVDNYIYHVDGDGRPLSASHRHSVNNVDWRGVYRYSPDEVELVEVCVQSRVPSIYERRTMRDGLPATWQSLRVNGGGNYPIWRSMPRAQVRDAITSDPRAHFCLVERYESSEGQLMSGEGCCVGLGTALRHWTLSFAYAAEGTLQRVTQHWDTGEETTAFAARTKPSPSALAKKLSRAHRHERRRIIECACA